MADLIVNLLADEREIGHFDADGNFIEDKVRLSEVMCSCVGGSGHVCYHRVVFDCRGALTFL